VSRVAELLIILDVDGVLNPVMGEDYSLEIEPWRAELVRSLATTGEIVGGSSWDAEQLQSLAATIGMPTARAIKFRPNADPGAATPKLAAVRQWVHMRDLLEEFTWTAVVWIDDSLREDALTWLQGLGAPSLAVVPDRRLGLTVGHLEEIQAFVERLGLRSCE